MKILVPFTICLIVLLGTYFVQTKSGHSQVINSISPFVPTKKVGKEINGILVVYPRDNSEINAASTFLVGAVSEGDTLTCNGKPVILNKNNYFAHKVLLSHGINNFTLTTNKSHSLSLTIKRPNWQTTLAEFPPMIRQSSLTPRQDMSLAYADVLELSMQGSPGGSAKVNIGGRIIKLNEIGNKRKEPVNLGRTTTYGIAQQTSKAVSPGIYKGIYRIQTTDNWRAIRPIYTLEKAGKITSFTSPHKITIVQQPLTGTTLHDQTIVRFAPELARTTPLPAGVNLVIDGATGKYWRIELTANRHVYILKEDIAITNNSVNGQEHIEPIRTVNLDWDNSEERVIIPLSQRLPFQIEQTVSPSKLVLKLFGAAADTDWIIPSNLVEAENNKLVSRDTQIVNYLTWGQPEDKYYELTVNLKNNQQWGFWADYDNTNLVLHVRKAPSLSNNLNGLIICIDPGHGGNEAGSIGCSGIREAEINLAIAQRLKVYLEKEQAKVIMTREDDRDVSLAERVEIARRAKVNILVSVHNNALPDGRDPLVEHGSSTFWYHPQAIKLARQLRTSLVQKLGFIDHGTLYQNLALCRPSDMLACLVEVGFMINPDEYAQLSQAEFQDKAASALKDGIKTFLMETDKTNSNKNND